MVNKRPLRYQIYSLLRIRRESAAAAATETPTNNDCKSFGIQILWFDKNGIRFDKTNEFIYTKNESLLEAIIFPSLEYNYIDWYYSVLAHVYEAYAQATMNRGEIEAFDNELKRRIKDALFHKARNSRVTCRFLDMAPGTWTVVPTVRGMGENAVPALLGKNHHSYNIYTVIQESPELQKRIDNNNNFSEIHFWVTHTRTIAEFYSAVLSWKKYKPRWMDLTY